MVSNTIEPLTLFHKMGVGRLDMYVLNPVKDSKEMQFLMQKWAGNSKAKTGTCWLMGRRLRSRALPDLHHRLCGLVASQPH